MTQKQRKVLKRMAGDLVNALEKHDDEDAAQALEDLYNVGTGFLDGLEKS